MSSRLVTLILLAMTLLPAPSWSQREFPVSPDRINVRLAFVQTSNTSSRTGLAIPTDDALRLSRLREVGDRATDTSIRELGDISQEPVLQARIGQESAWTMQGRGQTPILQNGQEAGIGPELDFGMRLGVTVHPRKDGRLRVFVRTKITGVDFERSVEVDDDVVFPTITTSGITLYKDIQPGETLMLTGLMDQESRRVLRRTPTDSKNDSLTRLLAEREKPDAGQLIVLITPEPAQ